MKWEQDLVRDVRTHSAYDDNDWPGYLISNIEVSDCNLSAVESRFLSVRDRCRAILEIGIHRNSTRSVAEIFFKHKLQSTAYVGIDLDNKSYLNNPAQNIFTIQADSSNFDANMQIIRGLGITEFDFIFIDGYHSINQVLRDWEYTRYLSDYGIVGMHDTNIHPGPQRFVSSLDTTKWDVEPNVCLGYDWGVGFAKKKNLNKTYYDFVEIGTCNFDTLVETATDNDIGLSVEPIEYYLNQLPDKPNVTKVAAALVADEDYQPYLDVYYIPEEDIISRGLPAWIRGCNSVGRPHDFHTGFYLNSVEWHLAADKSKLQTVDLTKLGIVKQKQVSCYTFEMLVNKYAIERIKFLKIDTEGSDARIVASIIRYYRTINRLDLLPEKIIFETNAHTKSEEILAAVQLLGANGYSVSMTQSDTMAVLSPTKQAV